MFPQGFALPAPEGELEKNMSLHKVPASTLSGSSDKNHVYSREYAASAPGGGGQNHMPHVLAAPAPSREVPLGFPGSCRGFPRNFPVFSRESAGNNRGSRRHLIGTRGLWHFFLWILCLGATGTLKLNVFESLCPPAPGGNSEQIMYLHRVLASTLSGVSD